MSMTLAFRLGYKCWHCDTELEVRLRRRFPDGQLEAALVHDHIETDWKPVTGFEDNLRFDEVTKAAEAGMRVSIVPLPAVPELRPARFTHRMTEATWVNPDDPEC